MTPRPTPRTARQAFPMATRKSLYTFVEEDPENRLVWPVVLVLCAALAGLIIFGIIKL